MRGTPVEAYALLVMTTLCWGGNAVLARLAVGEVSPLLLVTLRWIGAFGLLWIIAGKQVRRDWPQLRRHWLAIALMGGLGLAVFNQFLYLSAHSTQAVNIGIVQGSIPVLVVLGSWLAWRAAISLRQAAGIMLTLGGVVWVASQGDPARLWHLQVNPGDGLMLIGCLFYAGYAVALQRKLPGGLLSLFTLVSLAAMLASFPLLGFEWLSGRLLWPTPTGWLIIAVVVVFPSVLAQLGFMRAVALIGANRAGVFVNLVPIFAALLGVVFLSEHFADYHGLALALVIGGIMLAEQRRSRRMDNG